ncbi:MAG: hypothetical protein ABI844_01540 [Saprospiraceae bacterium]
MTHSTRPMRWLMIQSTMDINSQTIRVIQLTMVINTQIVVHTISVITRVTTSQRSSKGQGNQLQIVSVILWDTFLHSSRASCHVCSFRSWTDLYISGMINGV